MLRITLRDGEKAIINGAVVRAIGRTKLLIENRVSILRGSEVMQPEDATTPARSLYFTCMMAYVDLEQRDAHNDRILSDLQLVLKQMQQPAAQAACVRFANHLARNDYYRALASARELIAIEQTGSDSSETGDAIKAA
ncbi:flagellar biosynthesis repressor FlbT [Stakelama tenebrarum]|uniref:Flagellar biosynthesis repressor FlbT n=1 Tax=Stakelama tenebrarum TaxID=2711215 RepID=A0A6G6Y514_9SPHN|nr:flagellar biosynthesis repressor FlbT [Sphingosinithalassobacter tenebrarum]QIG79666.1 flagellar biosynthesis repressor FlbT [Sphingosinithalassobacter tenebrarum]